MPVSFRQAFAAGAASAAAQQDGQTEPEQLQKAQVAALMVDEVDAKKAGEHSAAKHAATRPPNPLETIEKVRGEHPKKGPRAKDVAHEEPKQPPGPGLLLKLARFFNLK